MVKRATAKTNRKWLRRTLGKKGYKSDMRKLAKKRTSSQSKWRKAPRRYDLAYRRKGRNVYVDYKRKRPYKRRRRVKK